MRNRGSGSATGASVTGGPALDHVIVTAPTDRGAALEGELSAALAEVRRRHPGVVFTTAVLGGSGRTITEALDDAAAAGARDVLVVSGQTVPDRPMDAWFRRVVGHWLRERDDPPRVRIAPLLTEVDGFADLLDAAVAAGGAPARTTTAPLVSPAWEEIPGFARHVLICRGPRCSAQGSGETQRAVAAELDALGLGDDDVLVTLTGCMFPCAQAPVVAVYPDGAWYAGLTADRAAKMVQRHLVGGEPVIEWFGRRAVSPDGP